MLALLLLLLELLSNKPLCPTAALALQGLLLLQLYATCGGFSAAADCIGSCTRVSLQWQGPCIAGMHAAASLGVCCTQLPLLLLLACAFRLCSAQQGTREQTQVVNCETCAAACCWLCEHTKGMHNVWKVRWAAYVCSAAVAA